MRNRSEYTTNMQLQRSARIAQGRVPLRPARQKPKEFPVLLIGPLLVMAGIFGYKFFSIFGI